MGTGSPDPHGILARRPARAVLLGLLVLGFMLGLRPDGAGAHTPVLPKAEPHESATTSGVTPLSAVSQVLGLADGTSLQLELADSSFGPTVGRLTSVLNSLPHGPEMSKLRIVMVDLNGLLQTCGGASSCYFTGEQKMVIPGDPDSINLPMPFEMTVAHEYGHHIERNRNFEDWWATGYGGRHWATHERVCEGVRAGQMFPGDQGAHYWENPGEAFAQAYAFMLYPTAVPWWWNIARPTEASYAAIRADVADTGDPRSERWGRSLTPRSGRASKTIATPLDGKLSIRVTQPPASRFKVVLVGSDGKVLERGRHYRAGSKTGRATARLSYELCGTRSVRLQVRRLAGKGKFTARIERP